MCFFLFDILTLKLIFSLIAFYFSKRGTPGYDALLDYLRTKGPGAPVNIALKVRFSLGFFYKTLSRDYLVTTTDLLVYLDGTKILG